MPMPRFSARGFSVNSIVCRPPGGPPDDVVIQLEGTVYPLAGFNFPPTTGAALQYGDGELAEIPMTIPQTSNGLGFFPTPIAYPNGNWAVDLTGDFCQANGTQNRLVVIWHEYASTTGGPPYVLIEVLEVPILPCGQVPAC